jgi:Tol biopolymer transport system component
MIGNCPARWLVVAAASLACARPAQREILFASLSGPGADPTTVSDIFAMRPDGSGIRQLTHGAVTRTESNFAIWSPDASRIVFIEGRNLHVMNADGNDDHEVVRLDSLNLAYPGWSPDGKRLSFSGGFTDSTGTNTSWVYVVNVDGTGLTRVSRSPIRSRGSRSPGACTTWLPDGSGLLMSNAGPPGPSRIVRLSVPSGETRLVVESDSLALFCAMVAPDGSSVVLTAWPSDGVKSAGHDMGIYGMDIDGSHLRLLVHGMTFAKDARWSWDGRFVIFHGTTTSPSFYDPRTRTVDLQEIFIADPDGGNLERLTRNERADVHPSW